MADRDPEQSLQEILKAFEAQHERRPSDEEAKAVRRRHEWLGEFEEHRERLIRAEFEQVAWAIEQRGHHAWVEDIATDPDCGGVTGIELKVLPVADQRTASHAPGIALLPDPGHQRVIAQVTGMDPASPGPHTVAQAGLESLDGPAVQRLATRLLDAVLLRAKRVLERDESDDPDDWAPERGGIVPPHGQSADWLA